MEDMMGNEVPLMYKDEGVKMLWIMYQTTEVVESQEDKLVSFPSFVGGVGGNLGLFLGFSCLTALFAIYKYISALWSKYVNQEYARGCFSNNGQNV